MNSGNFGKFRENSGELSAIQWGFVWRLIWIRWEFLEDFGAAPGFWEIWDFGAGSGDLGPQKAFVQTAMLLVQSFRNGAGPIVLIPQGGRNLVYWAGVWGGFCASSLGKGNTELTKFSGVQTKGQEKNNKLNLLWPKMARWDPLFDPWNSLCKSLYVGPFLAFFPGKWGTRKLFSGGRKWGVTGGGAKSWCWKVYVLFRSLKLEGKGLGP